MQRVRQEEIVSGNGFVPQANHPVTPTRQQALVPMPPAAQMAMSRAEYNLARLGMILGSMPHMIANPNMVFERMADTIDEYTTAVSWHDRCYMNISE